MAVKRIWISADHGLAVVYFLQSDVVPTLLAGGVEVVLLTDDGLVEQITRRFGQPGLVVEGLRFKQVHAYEQHDRDMQWWLQFLRRVGGSRRINTEAMDSYIRQVAVEESNRRRLFMPLAWAAILGLRYSSMLRRGLVKYQQRYSPRLYADLFDRLPPDLVIASTPGWRSDRYLLREAAARQVKTAAVVVGWDNPSSYSLPGAMVDWITCWSEIQKQELVFGSDWPADRVHVGGIPSYDGYFRRQWLIPRADYFQMHGLDPRRKLIAYASSFVSYYPNYQNIEALAKLVSEDRLAEPCQLLVRLHPNHFWNNPLYSGERERVRQLAQTLPHVHLVEPVPLGGELGYYSGEDMPEKTSMMAYADIFTTVYSTMVVETAIHERPIVSVCLDIPGGWNTPRKYSLPLTEIGSWPTHSRFREAGAGKVATSLDGLRLVLDDYLRHPDDDVERARQFVQRECTYTDGCAGRRTGAFLLSLLDKPKPGAWR
jgi:hypothetical protein